MPFAEVDSQRSHRRDGGAHRPLIDHDVFGAADAAGLTHPEPAGAAIAGRLGELRG